MTKEQQEVAEMAYRLLHAMGWESQNQSKNEFYYKLEEWCSRGGIAKAPLDE